MGRAAKGILCAYLAITLILTAFCASVVLQDCVNKAVFDEFILLPVLNMKRFSSAGTPGQTLAAAEAYSHWLCQAGYGADDPLCRFMNGALSVALANLILYAALRLLGTKFSKRAFQMVCAAGAIALILIAALRVYMRDCYGIAEVGSCFPVAYRSLPAMLFLSFASFRIGRN